MNYVPSEFESTGKPVGNLRATAMSPRIVGDLAHNRDTLDEERCLLIIDSRTLERECLATTLTRNGLGMEAFAVGSIAEWKRRKDNTQRVSAILLNIAGRKANDGALSDEIAAISAEFAPAPVVILADGDDLSQTLKVLEYGARGFIPTSVGIEVCVEAIALAIAGGTFILASNSFSAPAPMDRNPKARELARMFTLRQAEVVQALRKGKANKIIAYELNLRESTVKVHIRNIMKKLKATNRTEVAYKLNDIFQSDSRWNIPAE
ncbi:helix-turn-helix transcriptional regulator [Rhizobium sp. AC44/96]|uniref:helix-turn-helix transcriptional regulator n=1 Tax=unclassified Rhizobium TaxID=2613769 RepID=UPI0008100177|nr:MULTISPECIES: response regulator transcription factor [unclassified Rhizobium]MDM9620281.1 response regulator transcription factor [Rhizobium sp. S96]OCJ09214.1 helix-turn-helix transcriptional regulator [Rhizobium sp. AC44/96]